MLMPRAYDAREPPARMTIDHTETATGRRTSMQVERGRTVIKP
jgi:hypothetical protein